MIKATIHSRRKSKSIRNTMHLVKKQGALFIMVALPLAVIILFKYFPMYGIQIAFRNFRISSTIEASEWVGFKYVQKFMDSYLFWRILRNTLVLNLYSLATFALPLIFALMLNYLPMRRYKKTIQMVSYIPHFISTIVMCTMITQFLSARTGAINAFLNLLGVESVNYMAKPEYFSSIYVWSGVWQEIGYNSIIYIAALAGISPELHEAAIVDGANITKRIWHVDIPGVLPTFCIMLILRCGSLMSVGFEKVLLLQNNLNTDVSQVISTYVYNIGIAAARTQYSYAAAIDLFTAVINMILLFTVNKVTEKLSGTALF